MASILAYPISLLAGLRRDFHRYPTTWIGGSSPEPSTTGRVNRATRMAGLADLSSDVLVHAEEVRRIEFRFQCHEPPVVFAVGVLHSLDTFVAIEIVDVDPSCHVGLQRLVERPGPADVPLRVGAIGPVGEDDDVVLQIPVVVYGLGFADTAVGPVVVVDTITESGEGIRAAKSTSAPIASSLIRSVRLDLQ